MESFDLQCVINITAMFYVHVVSLLKRFVRFNAFVAVFLLPTCFTLSDLKYNLACKMFLANVKERPNFRGVHV